jgi:membrane-associated phospholipid phosphatase
MGPDSERWYWNPESIIRVQEFFGTGSEVPFRLITLLGDWRVILLVGAIILWTKGRTHPYTALAVTMLGALAVALIKMGTDVPRPDHIDIIAYEIRTSSSFPSGHAMHSVAFWGTLAYLGQIRPPVVVLIATGVMLSRIYLGVHYPIDVIAGAAIGMTGIGVGYLIWTRVFPHLTGERLGYLAGTIFLSSILIVPIAEQYALGWEVVGGLLGAGIGTFLEAHRLQYHPQSRDLRATIQRAGVGLSGALFLGLCIALVRDVIDLGVVNLIAGLSIGLWATFIAPYILVRIGLGEAANFPTISSHIRAPRDSISS